MGVTSFEINKLTEIISKYNILSVIEAGSQTNYTTANQITPPFMSEWYNKRGVEYDCIDMAGDNMAYKYDLSKPKSTSTQYGLVTNFGTSEHVVIMKEYISVPFHEGHINSVYPTGEVSNDEIEVGHYNCWVNLHNLLKVGGIMFNVNPLTNHWPSHGYSYLGENFYKELIKIAGYELIEDGIVCGSNNCDSGKNVYAILKKISNVFPEINTFNKLPIFKK